MSFINEKDFGNIEDLRQNSEFLKQLENSENSAIFEKNIEKLYDVLDSLLMLGNQNERIDKIYNLILEFALSHFHQKLETNENFNLEISNDHYTLRAIYEFAIEQYHSNAFIEAEELFVMLSIITEEPLFKGAMQIHLIAVLKKIEFNKFIEDFVDMERMNLENESFFILYFKDNANKFLHDNACLLRESIKRSQEMK